MAGEKPNVGVRLYQGREPVVAGLLSDKRGERR